MRGPSQLKREFVKKWAKGLQIYTSSNKEMSFLERKKAIKLSADVAMASTRTHTTCWGRAVIAEASNIDDTSKVVVEHVLGPDHTTNNVMSWVRKGRGVCNNINKKVIRSKKILRKSCAVGRRRKMEVGKVVMAANAHCIMAKKMLKKRTQVLKSLVPGGRLMDDDAFLIQEALDYIISLRVQVNVMRRLVKITDQLVDHRGKGAVTS